MVSTQRKFIEAAIEETRDAKQLLLPVLMATDPDDPWTATNLSGLADEIDTFDPVLRDAVQLLLDFERPFLVEEERLAAAGVTLAADMAAFEVAMVTFERDFWEARFAEYREDPSRWPLRDRPNYDVCETHRLDSDRVRHAIREHGATTFEDIAPMLGTSPTCSECHVGVTRLLIHEVRRQKAGTV